MPAHSSFSSGLSIKGSICCCSCEELRVDAAASSAKKVARLASALLAIAVVRVTPEWMLRAQSLTSRSLTSERCVTVSTERLISASPNRPTTHMMMIMASKTENPPARRVPNFRFFIASPVFPPAPGRRPSGKSAPR